MLKVLVFLIRGPREFELVFEFQGVPSIALFEDNDIAELLYVPHALILSSSI